MVMVSSAGPNMDQFGTFFPHMYYVQKGITKSMCRANTESVLLLGSIKIMLYIIVVIRGIECVAHKLNDVRGSSKGYFTSR